MLLREIKSQKYKSAKELMASLYPDHEGHTGDTAVVWMSRSKWNQLLDVVNAGAKIAIRHIDGPEHLAGKRVASEIKSMKSKGFHVFAQSPEDEHDRTEIIFTKSLH